MKIRGINYHIEVKSEGEPLVFLHGFTGSSLNWEHLTTQFPQYQLIFIDIIGHGKTDSSVDPSRYEMKEVVEDLISIFDSLLIDKANVLGYSMGGRLALSLAATEPNRIRSLILESSSPGLNSQEERSTRKQSDQMLANEIKEKGINAFVDKWEKIPLFSTQNRLPHETRERIRQLRLQNSSIGLANSLIGMGTGSQPSWWNKLSHIDIPVLLLCGELDPKFCDIAKSMHNLLPNSYIKEINDAGHAIHVEQPRIFGKIVNEFLNKQN